MATFTEIPNSTVDTQDALTMFEGNQMVFVLNGRTKKIVDFLNTKLTVASPLTTPPLRGDVLTQATTEAQMVVQFVNLTKDTIYGYRITEAEFNTTDNVTSNNVGEQEMSPSSFVPATVVEPDTPHCYDWTNHPSNINNLPERAYIGCMYMGRAVIAGNPADPNQWYMSRQNDPFDWDYGAADAQTPVAGESTLAGKAGDIIRALIPYNDDYLFFGCASSIWVMQGDPAVGGTLQPLTNTTGIYSSTSWCFDDAGNLFFLGDAGIYRCSVAEGVSKPQNITSVIIPKLKDELALNHKTHRVMMAYDKKRHGILVSTTYLPTGENYNFWIDSLTGGFFPERYQNECGAYSMIYFDADTEAESGLLMGNQDGFIRKFNDAQTYDEAYGDVGIDSKCLLPVIPAGQDSARTGRLVDLTFVTAGGGADGSRGDSDEVGYKLYSGDCPEAVIEKAEDDAVPLYSGTLKGAGKHHQIRKRIRGRSIGILLKNDEINKGWALEQAEIDLRQSGRV